MVSAWGANNEVQSILLANYLSHDINNLLYSISKIWEDIKMEHKKLCELCQKKEACFEKYKGLWLCPECRHKEQQNIESDKCKDL